MDWPDRDRALDRFVAGMPVDEDDLADAVAARTVDVALIVDALLLGLDDDAAEIRLRAAERIARLVALPPRLQARLHRLAATDTNRHVRAAAEATLLAHEPQVDPKPPGRAEALRAALASIWLVPRATRGASVWGTSGAAHVVREFRAQDRAEGPSVHGALIEQDLRLRLELKRLPEQFRGRRLALRVPGDADGPERELGTAAMLTDETGFVSIDIVAGDRTVEDIAELLSSAFEIVIVED